MSAIVAGLCAALVATTARAELIPAGRVADWTPGVAVGVPGGIDQYLPGGAQERVDLINVAKAPYHADNTGVNDATGAINSAIAAAKPGQVVYIPAGTYLLKGQISTGYRKNITIRGAGHTTVLKPMGAATALYVGGESDYAWTNPDLAIDADLAKGETVIPLSNTAAFSVGNIVSISILNGRDPALPVVSTAGYERLRRQKSRVVAKTASSITIFPGLYYDMPKSLEPRISRTANVAEFIGVEDLAIDFTNSTAPFGVKLKQAYACWFRNVKLTDVTNRHLYVSDTVQCEIRRCELLRRRGDGSNGAGLLFQSSSACLVEDNIITSISSLIQINYGASGNVFAYNFLYDSTLTGVPGPALKTNHGPHNSHNLFEGNMTPNIQCDGYFGSSSDDTFFRNWIHGTNPGKKGWMVSLNRLTRNYSLIGNIIGTPGVVNGSYSFGNPNMGNADWSGTVRPSLGEWWADMAVTGTVMTRLADTTAVILLKNGTLKSGGSLAVSWDNEKSRRENFALSIGIGNLLTVSGGSGSPLPAVGTEVRFWKGPSGFQEKDLDVEASTILKGNILVSGTSGVTPASEALAAPLPASLFRSSKPAWYGNLPWPAMSSISPAPSFDSIPAGYRYVHGTDAPGGGAQPPPVVIQPPLNVRIQ